ncbi:MAG: class I SAM-dependent methyltransferase [Microcoleaceae cyanobacterium MO_207.B10]|nr:class I SAM-dependent methyltransferase [Microcoleaceae cyanobacterium MO_207.B10]
MMLNSLINKQIKPKMQKVWRTSRMATFLKLLRPQKGAKVLDLGGRPEMWEMIDIDLDITLLNLSTELEKYNRNREKNWKQNYRWIEGDACSLPFFADGEFDLVFSNSVIEHIGGLEKQKMFAQNVRRLASSYWIQTPSIWFPIEAHCNLPLWWFYPTSLKQWWINWWEKQGQEFIRQQMSETRVLTVSELRLLFPEAQVYTEYVAGFPKSYCMYTNSHIGEVQNSFVLGSRE